MLDLGKTNSKTWEKDQTNKNKINNNNINNISTYDFEMFWKNYPHARK